MRATLSTFTLVCLLAAFYFQPSQSHLPPFFKEKLLGKGQSGKEAGGTALAAVISSRKFGLGIKAVLLKPLLLVALAKIKFALLLGKPLALLVIKKLLLKAVLGKLLLKIPLILLKGKALLVKMMALKFALVTKGLLGFKAPLAMLFLGACALGSGLGLALALGGTLHKLKEGSYEEEYDDYDEYYPPARPAYGAPRPAYPSPPAYRHASDYSPDAAYSSPTGLSSSSRHTGNSGTQVYSQSVGIGAQSTYSGYVDRDTGNRRKRDYSSLNFLNIPEDENVEESGEEGGDEEEETMDESVEDLQLEFEAARTNGNAYLYMAAQFDEQSCGRRLICEIYQKPHDSLTEDEILLQEIFGYPLLPLSEEDEGTPKEMYFRAAQLGTSYQGWANDKVCARFYPACPHDANQLIRIFVTDDIQANSIDSDDEPSAHLQPPQTSFRRPFYQTYLSSNTQLQPPKPVFRSDRQEPATILRKPHQVRRAMEMAHNSTTKILQRSTSCLNCRH